MVITCSSLWHTYIHTLIVSLSLSFSKSKSTKWKTWQVSLSVSVVTHYLNRWRFTSQSNKSNTKGRKHKCIRLPNTAPRHSRQWRHRSFDEPRFSRRVSRNNDRGFPLTRRRFNRFIAFLEFIGFDPVGFLDKSAQIVCKLFNHALKGRPESVWKEANLCCKIKADARSK